MEMSNQTLLHLMTLLSMSNATGDSVKGSNTASASILYDVSDSYWKWKMKEFPKIATFKGIHDYDDTLEEYSLAAFDRRRDDCQKMLDTLDLVKEDELAIHEQRDLEVLRADLQYFLEGYRWRLYGALNPINFLEGVYRSPGWIKAMGYKNEHDYERFASRMHAFSRQIDQIIDLMRMAIRLNRTNHAVSMADVTNTIQRTLQTPDDKMHYYWPFTDQLRNPYFNDTFWAELKQHGLTLVSKVVRPAIQRLYDFLTNEYMRNTRRAWGVGAFDNGQAYYQACLKFHLSTNATAKEVRDVGIKEVARIKALMVQIMEREHFTGTIREFVDFLREYRQKDFFNRTADELLAGYRKIIYEIVQPKLNDIVDPVPDQPVNVEPMVYDGPAGSYGTNTFYVNLKRPLTRPTFLMMALALHEANPGHHLQMAYQRWLPLPDFRRNFWGSYYYSVPFNFPWYTAYTEGWGLYAEYLGEEMGVYNDEKLELFGRYSSEMFRACRLVVDTGIHAFGMTRNEAIQYLADHTAIPLTQIEREVDRYITWPGQACAYKMGELEILRLRQIAEEQLGADFDVRRFNQQILTIGRVPMDVLKEHILKWVDEQDVPGGKLGAVSIASDLCSISILNLVICAFISISMH